MVVGTQLRRLREEKGITREEAGYVIRASESKMSRLELGRVSFKLRDIEDLLTFYGVEEEGERTKFLSFVEQANKPGWWRHTYDDVLPQWFETYVGLEVAATMIRSYEVQFVPGLLQTEDYARASVTAGLPDVKTDEVERRVQLRMTRQNVLSRPEPPTLWMVVDEAALRRPMGGRRVMRAQIEYLLDRMKEPNITIQVMPFRSSAHAADGGAFSMLRFGEQDLPEIVYLEQLAGSLYLDRPEHVDLYHQAMDRLTVDSLTPDATTDLLTKITSQL